MPYEPPNRLSRPRGFSYFSKSMLLDFSAVDGRMPKKIKICAELGYTYPRFSGIYLTPSELGDILSGTSSIYVMTLSPGDIDLATDLIPEVMYSVNSEKVIFL